MLASFPAPSHSQNNDLQKAISLFNEKQYDRALSVLQSAIETSQDKATVHYYIALCHDKSGRKIEALKEFQHIVQYYPGTNAAGQALRILQAHRVLPANANTHAPRQPTATAKTRPAKKEVYYRFQPPYSVELTKDKESKHLFLKACVEGVDTTMLFDTGASITTFTKASLRKLGITVNKLSAGHTVAGAGGEAAAYKASVKIKVGGLERLVPIMVLEENRSADPHPILGQTFFKDLVYNVNASIMVLSFFPDSPDSTGKVKERIPFTMHGDKIIVKGKINGKETDFILDTGAELVTFSDKHLARCDINRPVNAKYSQTRRAIGGTLREYMFDLGSVSLGPVARKHVGATMTLDTRFEYPLLGMSFLDGINFEVDNKKKLILFF